MFPKELRSLVRLQDFDRQQLKHYSQACVCASIRDPKLFLRFHLDSFPQSFCTIGDQYTILSEKRVRSNFPYMTDK